MCIGAGVSRGIAPTWAELTRRLVNDTFGLGLSDPDFRKLVADSVWSLDSWIQACANHFQLEGRAEAEFFEQIERHHRHFGDKESDYSLRHSPRTARRAEPAPPDV